MSTTREPATTEEPRRSKTFAGDALQWSGKSAEEVRRTGAIDSADDRVEALFAERYQTASSPVHRAVWDRRFPVEVFALEQPVVSDSAAASEVMDHSLEVVRAHRHAGTLLDDSGRISEDVMADLADAGYWGLLIDSEYGGSGASFTQFAMFLTRMAMVDPMVAGLASVHGCIGAVDPLRTFGTAEQKSRLLPKLASGERLSAFALTEPCAGSDLTALRTRAVRDGDSYVLNGEKLFITNVLPGRMIGVVCLIDDEPAVLIAELPAEENAHFRLKKYGLYALPRAHNYGILFHDFRVPVENRLDPGDGDGLTIAYHGLNRGRVALCATASGMMRMMLADMLPWARFRRTYGEPIIRRELVQRRVGELAGLIVACDALTAWCSSLLDLGYRGEMECIIAKIFGSEAQKHAAIELHMKTHGGRAFLHGHLFGDNVHDFLAPCIYEGEGEMLGLAFFKSLVKQHGRMFFEPIGRQLQASGLRQLNPANPKHLWALRRPLADYSRWWVGRQMPRGGRPDWSQHAGSLAAHARHAARFLQDSALEISGTLRKHQLRLPDRQCRMAELSSRLQSAVVMLCTSLHAGRHSDERVRLAGEILCEQLTRQLEGERTTDRELKRAVELGALIAEEGFPGLEDVPDRGILMSYQQ